MNSKCIIGQPFGNQDLILLMSLKDKYLFPDKMLRALQLKLFSFFRYYFFSCITLIRAFTVEVPKIWEKNHILMENVYTLILSI